MFGFSHSAIRAYDTNSNVCWGSRKWFSTFFGYQIIFPKFSTYSVIDGLVVEVSLCNQIF